MTRPSPEELLAEAAQIAYFLHWPLDAILDLEHGDRRLFLSYAHTMAGVEPAEGAAPEEPPPAPEYTTE